MTRLIGTFGVASVAPGPVEPTSTLSAPNAPNVFAFVTAGLGSAVLVEAGRAPLGWGSRWATGDGVGVAVAVGAARVWTVETAAAATCATGRAMGCSPVLGVASGKPTVAASRAGLGTRLSKAATTFAGSVLGTIRRVNASTAGSGASRVSDCSYGRVNPKPTKPTTRSAAPEIRLQRACIRRNPGVRRCRRELKLVTFLRRSCQRGRKGAMGGCPNKRRPGKLSEN